MKSFIRILLLITIGITLGTLAEYLAWGTAAKYAVMLAGICIAQRCLRFEGAS
ncbi:hypothetical protein [Pseudomonas sp. SBB6]|uniref:hypothetical protein n=1 Tax=Pseudomonas sp. SBB6 TaxID=2962032 RepID=UPI0020B67F95|nr:hypothetical protein [Pseudomonas sp. SBB6]MCP3751872.1 hypothetical protein [Pseudomonas sp. SBB6]